MSETPRRKRFQIHLSTAVVMMIAAGGLIWANARSLYSLGYRYYGWPKTAFAYTMDPGADSPLEWSDDGTFRYAVNTTGMVVDTTIALAILFAVWFVSEWWIRRRAARKGT